MKKIIITAALITLMAIPVKAEDVTEGNVTSIEIGSSRADIHTALGEPRSFTVNGIKEQFSLTHGGSAVLIYNTYGYLDYGYIVK